MCPHGRLGMSGLSIVLWHDVKINSGKVAIKNHSSGKGE